MAKYTTKNAFSTLGIFWLCFAFAALFGSGILQFIGSILLITFSFGITGLFIWYKFNEKKAP
ncbi:hypothetical protein ACYSNW_02380 [Enterococcus sp. LJL99]